MPAESSPIGRAQAGRGRNPLATYMVRTPTSRRGFLLLGLLFLNIREMVKPRTYQCAMSSLERQRHINNEGEMRCIIDSAKL